MLQSMNMCVSLLWSARLIRIIPPANVVMMFVIADDIDSRSCSRIKHHFMQYFELISQFGASLNIDFVLVSNFDLELLGKIDVSIA